MRYIADAEAQKTIKILKESALVKSVEKSVRNMIKTVYVFNNCDFEVYEKSGTIIRIDVYKYLPNGQLYDLDERIVK